MGQIGKRHSTELKHQSSNRLCTPQRLRLGIFVKKPAEFTHRKSFLLADIHSRIYITKQTMNIGRTTRLYSTIIDAAKHTHISRHRIRLQARIIKMLSVTTQPVTSDLPERYAGITTKLIEREKSILIDMCRRKTTFFP